MACVSCSGTLRLAGVARSRARSMRPPGPVGRSAASLRLCLLIRRLLKPLEYQVELGEVEFRARALLQRPPRRGGDALNVGGDPHPGQAADNHAQADEAELLDVALRKDGEPPPPLRIARLQQLPAAGCKHAELDEVEAGAAVVVTLAEETQCALRDGQAQRAEGAAQLAEADRVRAVDVGTAEGAEQLQLVSELLLVCVID
jgi:hypothetical protein